MSEVAEGAPDARVAPVAVLGGHPHDQAADVLHEGRDGTTRLS